MSFSFSVIALIIYPLNFLWLLPSDVFGANAIFKNRTEREVIGEVRGVEKVKLESITQNLMPAVAIIQPIKKKNVVDLYLPNAHAALVLDVDSGTILHYDNGKDRRQIASLTKIMTAILAVEKINNLEEVVVIDQDAVSIEGTKIGCPRSGYCITQRLRVGEKITARNLLKAMLMNSANDAALALGKHIAGTEEEFVKMMNARAKEIGIQDTNFCTSSGLENSDDGAECYSTAYDIARIAAYSMKYDIIWEVFRLPNNTIITSADGKYFHEILNTDILSEQIPNRLGGKTGFTPLAGHSLLMGASDSTKKHRIIAVLLNDPYRWQDIKTMIDWTFQSYEWE